MRRSLSARIFTGLWALWLGVAIVEPAAVHSCGVHGVAAGSHHGDVTAEHRHHQSPEPSKEQHCSCIGECSAAQTVGAPAFGSVVVDIAEVPTRATVVAVLDDIAPAAEWPHARPFATAPPA